MKIKNAIAVVNTKNMKRHFFTINQQKKKKKKKKKKIENIITKLLS